MEKLADILARKASLIAERNALLEKKAEEWTDADIKRSRELEHEINVTNAKETAERARQAEIAAQEGAATADGQRGGDAGQAQPPAQTQGQPAQGEPGESRTAPAGGQIEPARRSPDNEPYDNLAQQLRDIVMVSNATMRFGNPSEWEQAYNRLQAVSAGQRAANESVDSQGGYFVQKSISKQLIEMRAPLLHFSSRCTTLPLDDGANALEIPFVQDKNEQDGYRFGGVTSAWFKEGETITETSTAQVEMLSFKLKKLATIWVASAEILRHGGVVKNLQMRQIAKAMAHSHEDAVVRGQGTKSPKGILSASNGALIIVAKETNQDSATFEYLNAVKMLARFDPDLIADAVWFMNQDLRSVLPLMNLAVGLGGSAVFIPAGGASAKPYDMLLGIPIVYSRYCNALGTKGDVILAAMTEYGILTQGGVREDSSIHVYFTTDKTAFRFIEDKDGAPLWYAPITPYKGTNTLSPFVVLADRS